MLKIDKLQYLMVMQNGSAILESYSSYCCRDIAIFRVFRVKGKKCKNSLDDRA